MSQVLSIWTSLSQTQTNFNPIFSSPDVEGNVTLASGDKVSFQMATMQRSGTLVARAIRLENPAKPVKYQGVVNSIKEQGKFGFIERYFINRFLERLLKVLISRLHSYSLNLKCYFRYERVKISNSKY